VLNIQGRKPITSGQQPATNIFISSLHGAILLFFSASCMASAKAE
jgi:hypothetical protein